MLRSHEFPWGYLGGNRWQVLTYVGINYLDFHLPGPMPVAFRTFASHLLLMVFCTLLNVTPVCAEGPPPGRFAFRGYGGDQGLTSSAITQLYQDSQGFLWVGTEDGLFRYDGSHFQAYSLKEGLPSALVTSIREDPKGGLWVGTFQGLAKWNGHAFERVEGVRDVQGLASGPDGRLWIATSGGPRTLSVQGALAGPQAVPGWPGGEASALYARPAGGSVWAARWTTQGGLPLAQVLRWQDGGWKRFVGSSSFGKERIDSLLADWQGNIWARSAGHLWMLPSGGDRFEEPKPDLPSIHAKGYLAPSRDGGIWVSSDLGMYHVQGTQWTQIGSNLGLPTEWSRSVLEDREGNLWFSSNGLFRLLGLGAWQSYTAKNGLPSEVVWSIFRDRSGQLWLGTDQGLSRATAKGWSVVPGTGQNAIRSIVEGRDGELFMAGTPPEVLAFNPTTQKLERFGAAAGIAGKRIFRLWMDKESNLWVATDGAGLLRGTQANGAWKFRSETLPGGDPQEYISGLFEDGQGRIFAAGSHGLAMRERGAWRRFTTRDGLRADHISYVTGTRNGELVLAYFEPLGLTRGRLEGGVFKVLSHEDSSTTLASDKIYLLGEDASDRLWIGSARGLDVITAAGSEHFGIQDGLVGEDCDAMAFRADADGTVWIGTSAGLGRFSPKAGEGTSAPPPTVILGFKLGEKHYLGYTSGKLEVDKAHNVFEVRFAGLSFAREGAVQHQVRLVGLEPDWRVTDSKMLRYPSLRKGRYIFEVRSRVGAGLWGPTRQITFEVLPAWWETWWFITLATLAGLGLMGWVLYRFVRREERARQALEALVAERTNELEAANRALQDQTITDPLTKLRNRRFLQFHMPQDAAQAQRRHRLLTVSRAERLALNIDMVFLMVDIDHFKDVNDTYGHTAGDHVLQQVAEILQACIRDTDTAVRWGGEEFLVVARNTSRRECTILVERIRSAMALHPFELDDGGRLHKSCSIGYACYPFIPEEPDFLDWERVVEIADQCLYAAKRGGRDSWVGIYPSDDAPAEHIKRAMAQGGMESLVRDGSLVVKASISDSANLAWNHSGGFPV